jgi:hypothetical protein
MSSHFSEISQSRQSRWKLAAAAFALFAGALPALANGQGEPLARSATVARDINGFHLGMPIAEARKLADLEYIGGDQFEATADGFQYNFGVTPTGRIYRIQSSQSLGRFSVDRTFVQSLRQKLSVKYGPPLSDYADVFSWEIIEDVTMPDGNKGPFRTMWMTAMIGGDESGRTLDITLIDFRILWADQASVNRAPRAEAEGRIAF